VIEYFDHTIDKFCIDVHGVLIEPIIKILSELFVLSLTIGGILQIKLQERMFENILRLDKIWRMLMLMWSVWMLILIFHLIKSLNLLYKCDFYKVYNYKFTIYNIKITNVINFQE
jgi:hypothetical protein